MKLAEALLLRADLQKATTSLRERVVRNGLVQEGEKPHEDPNRLLEDAFGLLKHLERLVFRINQANLKHKIADGRTLTEAIARRDLLAQKHSLLQAALNSTHREPDRYSRSEIKWVVTMDVAELQKQSSERAKEIRELNGMIQEANWKAELEE